MVLIAIQQPEGERERRRETGTEKKELWWRQTERRQTLTQRDKEQQ